MGPECEKDVRPDRDALEERQLKYLKEDCYEIATDSGFTGGTSNRQVVTRTTQKNSIDSGVSLTS